MQKLKIQEYSAFLIYLSQSVIFLKYAKFALFFLNATSLKRLGFFQGAKSVPNKLRNSCLFAYCDYIFDNDELLFIVWMLLCDVGLMQRERSH